MQSARKPPAYAEVFSPSRCWLAAPHIHTPLPPAWQCFLWLEESRNTPRSGRRGRGARPFFQVNLSLTVALRHHNVKRRYGGGTVIGLESRSQRE